MSTAQHVPHRRWGFRRAQVFASQWEAGRAREVDATAAMAPAARTRRLVVSVVTLVVGAAVMAWSLRIPAGDATFYPATLALAAVWLVGSLVAGRSRWLREGASRWGAAGRDLRAGVVAGLALLVLFLAGASIVAQIPFLRDPVEQLLAHARWGALWVVALITFINGVTEEIYFRGALFDATGGRRTLLWTTLAYAAVTATSGIALLVLAAVLLGLAAAALRRLTGALLGSVTAHLVWSLGMLFTLQPVLDLWK